MLHFQRSVNMMIADKYIIQIYISIEETEDEQMVSFKELQLIAIILKKKIGKRYQ